MSIARLNRNECALPPPQSVVDALRTLDAESLRSYPDETQRVLEGEIASYLQRRREEIVVANGADEILSGIARAYVYPGTQAIVADPSFEMYERVVELARGEVVRLPYRQRWRIGIDELLALTNERTRLIVLGNPNNPTLDIVDSRTLLALSAAVPQAIIVIDEVYLGLDGPSLLPVARTLSNVIVVRSLSKVAGLAGLRVGYACAQAEVATDVRRAIGPYPVGIASIVAATAYLRDTAQRVAFETRLAAQVQRSLDAMTGVLEPHARAVWRGPANFLLADLGSRASSIVDTLLQDGIAVRTFANPMLSGMFRVNAANDGLTDAFLSSARKALRSVTYA